MRLSREMRPLPVDGRLDPVREQVGDEIRAEREQEHLRPAECEGDDKSDDEEHPAELADIREPDEDLIEPAHPVLDHPALEPVVEPDHAETIIRWCRR